MSVPLKKEVCVRCCNEAAEAVPENGPCGWGDIDDQNWIVGNVLCPMAHCKTHNRQINPTTAVPDHCSRRAEHGESGESKDADAEKRVMEPLRGRCDTCRRQDVPLARDVDRRFEGQSLILDDDRASYAVVEIRWCADRFDDQNGIRVCVDCLREHLESVMRTC